MPADGLGAWRGGRFALTSLVDHLSGQLTLGIDFREAGVSEIFEDHPYLYHYTDFGGLKGILETQTIWATHYKALNDFSEVEHMRSVLENWTLKIVNAVMRQKAKQRFKYRRRFEKHGGLAATSRLVAKELVDRFYQVTFGSSGVLDPFAEPYVVSFCAHTHDSDYVKKNGLLSQWRAYGDDGGFALVFDTKRLCTCLETEWKTYEYSAFYLADVVYDNQEEKFEAEFGDLSGALEQFIHAEAEGAENPPAGGVLQPFFNAVTRFKHRGFEEENEVRLTASPIPESVYRRVEEEREEGDSPLKAIKTVHSREKHGNQAAYIILNDLPKKKRLPIIRIIVGSQRDQRQRAREVLKLIGNKRIGIVCSETPFIPV